MSVRLFYVDESFDSAKFCLSAIAIRHGDWRDCFARVRQHRVLLKRDHGLLIRKEIHATEFVAGRGRITAPGRIIGKHDRVRIFESMLRLVAQLPRVTVFNVCLEQKDHRNAQLAAWDRLINRIERTMLAFEEKEFPLRRRLAANLPPSVADQDRKMIEERLAAFRPRAMIFADKGRELEITRAVRKMAIFNPIPSAVGTWEDGEAVRNIPRRAPDRGSRIQGFASVLLHPACGLRRVRIAQARSSADASCEEVRHRSALRQERHRRVLQASVERRPVRNRPPVKQRGRPEGRPEQGRRSAAEGRSTKRRGFSRPSVHLSKRRKAPAAAGIRDDWVERSEPPIASITSVDVLVSSNRGTRRSRSIHPGK